MDSPAIAIERFTKRFGSRVAVDDLTLEVPRGSVFGLLGRNGAGKSTTIKCLLNLMGPTCGRMSVLGLDSVADAVAVRARVGYMPEQPGYYSWMTVAEAIAFHAAFHSTWDPALVADLLKRLELPTRQRLRDLSRGAQAKIGLVLALGSRPEVLLMDDPTSGLDAVVRRELLETIIAGVHADGGTVLLSTHMLHELERVADEVAVLHEGRLVARGSIESLKASTKRLHAVYPGPVPERFPIPGLLRVRRDPHQAVITVNGFVGSLPDQLRRAGAESVEVIDLSLEEIFVETVKGGPAHA